MSKRHRGDSLRNSAHWDAVARSARHEDRTALRQMTGPVSSDEVEDLFAPPAPKRPPKHRDPDQVDRSKRSKLAHWKMKTWKRRSAVRSQRSAELRAEKPETDIETY